MIDERRTSSNPLVSIGVVARNAGKSLAQCLEDLFVQDWPSENREFILVDGISTDDTRAIMEAFKAQHPRENVHVYANPKRILASGWNVLLRHAAGDIIVRVDAHSRVPDDFVRRNVERLRLGEQIVGGARISMPANDSFVSQLLWLAEVSGFGAGQASYRRLGGAGYVDTLAHASYRRSVFVKVGGYDERLGRTEDNEIHYRMKKAGFRFFYDPAIRSTHHVRGDMPGFLKQKYLNGYWIGITLGVSPQCFQLRHFVPLAFVCSLLACYFGGNPWGWLGLRLLLLVYSAFAVVFAVRAAIRCGDTIGSWRQRGIAAFLLPFTFLSVHLAYGIGTLLGILSIPFHQMRWRKRGGTFVPKPEAAAAKPFRFELGHWHQEKFVLTDGTTAYTVDSALTVRPMRAGEAREVAEVHCEAFRGYSLTLLGPRFLELYYEELRRDQAGITLVAERDNQVVGMAAGAMNPQGFYTRLYKRRWFAFMLAAIPGTLRHPKLIPRLLRTPGYPSKLPAGEGLVNLSSIAVRPSVKGAGVGANLMKEFLAQAKLRGMTCVVWGTKKQDKVANRFYEKIGYSEVKEFRDTQGEEILEYYLQI